MSVKRKLYIRQRAITVSFTEGVVRITNDDELQTLLNSSLYSGTTELVKEVKAEYYRIFGDHLRIADRSLAVEIWGHIYGEYFFRDLYRRIPWKPFNKLYRFVRYHCSIIDSGEAAKDSDRRLWDILAPGRKLIAGLLKRRLRRSFVRRNRR